MMESAIGTIALQQDACPHACMLDFSNSKERETSMPPRSQQWQRSQGQLKAFAACAPEGDGIEYM